MRHPLPDHITPIAHSPLSIKRRPGSLSRCLQKTELEPPRHPLDSLEAKGSPAASGLSVAFSPIRPPSALDAVGQHSSPLTLTLPLILTLTACHSHCLSLSLRHPLSHHPPLILSCACALTPYSPLSLSPTLHCAPLLPTHHDPHSLTLSLTRHARHSLCHASHSPTHSSCPSLSHSLTLAHHAPHSLTLTLFPIYLPPPSPHPHSRTHRAPHSLSLYSLLPSPPPSLTSPSPRAVRP